jgi:hypothetical protein
MKVSRNFSIILLTKSHLSVTYRCLSIRTAAVSSSCAPVRSPTIVTLVVFTATLNPSLSRILQGAVFQFRISLDLEHK